MRLIAPQTSMLSRLEYFLFPQDEQSTTYQELIDFLQVELTEESLEYAPQSFHRRDLFRILKQCAEYSPIAALCLEEWVDHSILTKDMKEPKAKKKKWKIPAKDSRFQEAATVVAAGWLGAEPPQTIISLDQKAKLAAYHRETARSFAVIGAIELAKTQKKELCSIDDPLIFVANLLVDVRKQDLNMCEFFASLIVAGTDSDAIGFFTLTEGDRQW